MQKSDLFELLTDVSVVLGNEKPIIVGSQVFHLLLGRPPRIVERSMECDFLFGPTQSDARNEVNRLFGVASDYQDRTGMYADGLGLATVVLPDGWHERLQPLNDNLGNVVALCVDIYDVSVSKLIAGREKDLEFLEYALAAEQLEMGKLLARLELATHKVENDTIPDRLSRLVKVLKGSDIHRSSLNAISDFLSAERWRRPHK